MRIFSFTLAAGGTACFSYGLVWALPRKRRQFDGYEVVVNLGFSPSFTLECAPLLHVWPFVVPEFVFSIGPSACFNVTMFPGEAVNIGIFSRSYSLADYQWRSYEDLESQFPNTENSRVLSNFLMNLQGPDMLNVSADAPARLIHYPSTPESLGFLYASLTPRPNTLAWPLDPRSRS